MRASGIAQGAGPASGRARTAKPASSSVRKGSKIIVDALPRRQLLAEGAAVLAAVVAVPGAARAATGSSTRAPGDWTTPGLNVPEDPTAPKFYRTPGGVKVQELAVGSGPPAAPGDAVLFDYTLRRADGYFVYATLEGVSFQPRDVPVGPVAFRLGGGDLIPGLEEVLAGMAPGGRRRALVPPELGYTSSALQPQPPTFATKRQLANHSREPLLFEVQLLRVNSQK
ncbi:MAG: hypothetical protein J3K34DRAFT_385891 [Monoraphidium minutum]|nr:MAG: hypothetical protein J3K34DRAFT_385891 [Monoraphidium minutum]